jgi:hypothetical protein
MQLAPEWMGMLTMFFMASEIVFSFHYHIQNDCGTHSAFHQLTAQTTGRGGIIHRIYSGFRLIRSRVNSGSRLSGANPDEQKQIREYNQNLLSLFGAPCHLIGPVTATWCACDHYIIKASLSQYK